MLQFVTVNWRDYLGRGVEYTNTLYDMVRRNLPDGFEGNFTVFTDNTSEMRYTDGILVRPLPEGLNGWHNKLALFQDGLFADGDQVLFMDLDTVITGPLDAIASYRGQFATLADFYRLGGLQSSVMGWRVTNWPNNGMGWIWRDYVHAGHPEVEGGDQAWIEDCLKARGQICDIWQDLFPGDFVSFKKDASMGIPRGSKVCVFHGEPRPHEVTADWVPMVWKIGGGTSAEFVIEANVGFDAIRENILSAVNAGYRPVQIQDAHEGMALIVAGGPSLSKNIKTIEVMQEMGAKVWAVNGSYEYLHKAGIRPDAHVILDARPENITFVDPDATCNQYYSSQCHPSVLKIANNLSIYHPYFDGILDIVSDGSAYIGGGTTAGLKAAALSFALGYRKIHLFGFDSCYQDDKNHAYEQRLNDGERVLDVSWNGRDFRCAPWMVTQAEDFMSLATELTSMGAEITVHGTGFVPYIAEVMDEMKENLPAAELRSQAILKHLDGHLAPKGVEVGVFTGELSKRLLGKRPDLKLLMVDSWAAHHNPEYAKSGDFHASLTQEAQDDYAKHAEAATSFAKDRAVIIRKPSVEAAKCIDDESLDFAFIDADHSYEGCKADLNAWWPKVKPGGLFSGHDYENTDYPGFGVTQAVTEFVASHNLQLELGENFTWFTRKPNNGVSL